jgi:hypothetical protein
LFLKKPGCVVRIRSTPIKIHPHDFFLQAEEETLWIFLYRGSAWITSPSVFFVAFPFPATDAIPFSVESLPFAFRGQREMKSIFSKNVAVRVSRQIKHDPEHRRVHRGAKRPPAKPEWFRLPATPQNAPVFACKRDPAPRGSVVCETAAGGHFSGFFPGTA